jgi:hypothetical protein
MKKVNKKAILAMLVAMVMSLGMMGGINGESYDSNVQQAAAVCYIAASNSESTTGSITGYVASGLAAGVGAYGIELGGGLLFGTVAATVTNPVGWIAIFCGACYVV